ncbi:MAG: hypothetical protein ACLFUC_05285 [Bacteroidales bacterium]
MKLELFDYNALNFVELNTTGDNENYIKCAQESKFVSTDVFNLFAICFENSNKLYEYFGPTKYNARRIVPLQNELLKYKDNLQSIKSKEEFIEHVTGIFLGNNFLLEIEKLDKNWEKNWQQYRDKLINMNNQLLMIVDDCIENEKILWVIGY